MIDLVRAFSRRARKSLLVQNAAWLFAGQGLSFVVQGFYFIVLARLLGTKQYGLLAGAFALVGIVGQYSPLGSGILFLRYVSADRSRFRLYWGNILISVLVLGSLLVLLLTLSGRWLVGAETVPLLLPVAIAECLFQQLGTCAGQVFQTFEQMKFSAGLTLLSSVSRCLLAIAMLTVMGRATAWQWAIGSLSVSCLAACIAIGIVTRRFGLPLFSPSLWIKRAVEGFVFAISGSTTVVYNDVDKVVLAHYGMDRANGIYSMAYRVVNIGAMPIQSIVGAALPRFFREGAKGISCDRSHGASPAAAHRGAGHPGFAGHVCVRSHHPIAGGQVFCGVGHCAALVVPDSILSLFSFKRGRRDRRGRAPEVSPGLAIHRCGG